MECTTTTLEVYGQNNARLGVLDAKGNVWFGEIIIFRIVGDHVYSIHERYLRLMRCATGRKPQQR